MAKMIDAAIGSGAGIRYKVARDEQSQIANNDGT